MEFKILTQMKLSYESKQNFMELAEHETQLLAEINQALQLLQTDVSSRRELLFAFEKMRTEHIIGATDEWRYSNVDLFLSK